MAQILRHSRLEAHSNTRKAKIFAPYKPETENIPKKQESILLLKAVEREDYAELNRLIYTVDLETKDRDGWTSLMIASSYGQIRDVNLLMEKGANIEARNNLGMSVLMIAVLSRQTDIVKLLIGKGADVNAMNIFGMNILTYARENKLQDMVGLLQEAGAEE